MYTEKYKHPFFKNPGSYMKLYTEVHINHLKQPASLYFTLLSFIKICGMGKILQELICSLSQISFLLQSRLLISEDQLCFAGGCLTRNLNLLEFKSGLVKKSYKNNLAEGKFTPTYLKNHKYTLIFKRHSK